MCLACTRAVRTVALLCWLLPLGMAQPQANTRREALGERPPGTNSPSIPGFGGQERYSAEALHRLDEKETAVDEQLQQALDRADKAGLLAPYYEEGTTAASLSVCGRVAGKCSGRFGQRFLLLTCIGFHTGCGCRGWPPLGTTAV